MKTKLLPAFGFFAGGAFAQSNTPGSTPAAPAASVKLDKFVVSATRTERALGASHAYLNVDRSSHAAALITGVRVDRFKLPPDNPPLDLATTAGAHAPSFDEAAVTPRLGVLLGPTKTLNAYAQCNCSSRNPTVEDLAAQVRY